MNKANILKLADHIEGLDLEEYDQSVFAHDCGTPACIAGHAVFLAGQWDQASVSRVARLARRWLGLQRSDAESASVVLFDSHPLHPDETPSPQEAAATLRHLAETGEVDWRRAE